MPQSSSTTALVTTSVTFCFFFVEALLHFNIGKTGRISLTSFPSNKEMLKIVFVVAFFSILSGFVATMISGWFDAPSASAATN